jgi:hypothetical protein
MRKYFPPTRTSNCHFCFEDAAGGIHRGSKVQEGALSIFQSTPNSRLEPMHRGPDYSAMRSCRGPSMYISCFVCQLASFLCLLSSFPIRKVVVCRPKKGCGWHSSDRELEHHFANGKLRVFTFEVSQINSQILNWESVCITSSLSRGRTRARVYIHEVTSSSINPCLHNQKHTRKFRAWPKRHAESQLCHSRFPPGKIILSDLCRDMCLSTLQYNFA